ncbi:MAG: tail fiber protein [Anaerolineae bacterium]
MSDPFIGEIRLFGFNFAPRGWAQCNGQLLPIAQNTALFSILGTMYGGNGQTTFGLPDLQGRSALHFGQGPGLSYRDLGESGGEPAVTLVTSQMAQHTHTAAASTNLGDQTDPANNVWATGAGGRGQNFYASGSDVAMSSQAIGPAGGSQPHNNLPPYLALNFCICLSGVYPPRS